MADGTVIIKIKGDTKEYEAVIKGIAGKTEQSLGTAIKGSMIGNLFANAFSSAAGVISNSMDKAISRVDTLNRFPKVMASIGYSADDAKAAINRMSDHIQGLPTTLDSIVSSTQRVVSSVGDVGKATDIMLAFNDALVAGGQSTQVQEAALEQFVQGVSKGKFELEEWRSITTAMPGPIDQVAKSILGADGNANKLYDAMKSGKVSVEDFTNAFVNLDNEGLNGLASFAEQAQTGAGGIQTSMENAANAVAVQVGKIIDKLNENGEITAAFDTLKQAITEGGSQISTAIGWIKDNFDSLAPIVGSIAAFIGAYKAWGLAVDTVTMAHKILDTVMSSSKIGIVIGLVAALVGALVTAYNTNEEFRNAVNTAWETISGIVGGAIEGIVGFFQMLGDALTQCGEWLSEAPQGIAEGFGQIGDLIGQGLQPAFDFFQRIGDALSQFGEWVSKIPQMVSDGFGQIGELIGQGLQPAFDFFQRIGDALSQFGEWFISLPESIMTGLGQIGEAIGTTFQGVLDGIGQFFSSIGEFLSQLPQMYIDYLGQCWDTITQWAAQIGQGAIDAGSGFLNGIIQFFSQLPGNILNFLSNILQNVFGWSPQMVQGAVTAASGFLNGIVRFFTQLPGRIASFLGNVISNVGSWVGQMASNAISAASQFASNLMDGLASLPSRVFEVGTNIIQGIVNGIQSAPGAVADALSNIVNGAIDNIKNMLGIHSPSRLMRDLIGANMAEGIAVGISKDKTAISSIKTLAGRITNAAQSGLGSIPVSFGNAQAKLSGLTTEAILGDAFMQGIDAVIGRLDSINERLKSIEDKMDRDGTISINGREFARLIKEYQ